MLAGQTKDVNSKSLWCVHEDERAHYDDNVKWQSIRISAVVSFVIEEQVVPRKKDDVLEDLTFCSTFFGLTVPVTFL